MSDKDYYRILGVSKNASADEIKKSYRNMAMKYHPDRNQDKGDSAGEHFKEISEAYYVLGDEKRRSEYDTYRRYGARGEFKGAEGFDFEEILRHFAGFTRPGGRKGSFSNAGFQNMFDIFEDMGDNGLHAEYVYTGAGPESDYRQFREDTDIEATLNIPANLAKNGGEALFNYNGRKITLKIRPSTRNGQRLRIRGQGKECPCCGHRGDLIVKIATA